MNQRVVRRIPVRRERLPDRLMADVRVSGPRRAVNNAADFFAAAFVQMRHGKFHCLLLIGADEPDSGVVLFGIAVNDDKRNGEPFFPVFELARLRADRNRRAELNAVEPLEVVLRENFQTEPVSGQLVRERHQKHFHAALHRIDRFVRSDDHHVPLFCGKTRMIRILFCDGKDAFPHILADIRMMTEHAGHGRW